jgi:dinuclear metal center YbgI/SA1388 family protein
MVKRDEIINFIKITIGEELLFRAARVDPEAANGVQFLGQEEVTKVALGVTANALLFQKAKNYGAEFVVVHHGLRLSGVRTRIPVTLQKTLKELFELNATLCGFHFSLDNHPRLGNNAQIINLLGAQKTYENFYEEWGWVAEYAEPKSLDWFLKSCQKVFGVKPEGFFHGKKKIKRIAVVSGGGSPYPYTNEVWDWREKRIDLYLTGEAKEPTQEICREAGMNYVYVGHYNSEKFGVKALGEEIRKRFPALDVEFLDIPNPL